MTEGIGEINESWKRGGTASHATATTGNGLETLLRAYLLARSGRLRGRMSTEG
jgi:hypothetical protein